MKTTHSLWWHTHTHTHPGQCRSTHPHPAAILLLLPPPAELSLSMCQSHPRFTSSCLCPLTAARPLTMVALPTYCLAPHLPSILSLSHTHRGSHTLAHPPPSRSPRPPLSAGCFSFNEVSFFFFFFCHCSFNFSRTHAHGHSRTWTFTHVRNAEWRATL